MTDLRKKIREIIEHNYPTADWKRVDAELSYLEENNVLVSLFNIYQDIQSNPSSRGDENKQNLAVGFYLHITTKPHDPSRGFEIPKRRTYGRSGFPDIDMDFDYEKRHLIDEYLKNKYGKDKVAHIGTIQQLKTKAAVRRVIKVLDPENFVVFDAQGNRIKDEKSLNFQLEQKILNPLPDLMKRPDGSFVSSVKQAAEEYELFGQYMKQYPEVYRYSRYLEGKISGFASHAAGIVLSPIPLERICPLHVTHGDAEYAGKEKTVATQFNMGEVEELGLIKFDILGLSTKTAVSFAHNLILERHGINLDLSNLPLNDQLTLELLRGGKTDGCFQLENTGMKQTLQQIRISSFDDLVVAIAMYRPGPKDYIPMFAKRKHGQEKVHHYHELMKKITEKTYGILCYQEDTLVSMADGSEKKIKHVTKGDLVHSLNPSTLKIEIKECHGAGFTKIRDGLKVELENGYSLVVTPDHQIQTYYGMKRADCLSLENDLIACPLYKPCNGTSEDIAPWLGKDDNIAYLLGQLTGDGSIGKSVSISCGSKEKADLLADWIAENLPLISCRKYFHSCWNLGISCSLLAQDKEHGNRKTKFHLFLDNHDLKTDCYKKRIPGFIMKHKNNRVKAAYLAGLFDSDGSITVSKSTGLTICHYTSVSSELINDLRCLLQCLGIAHQVREKRIHIWDSFKLRNEIERFLILKSFTGNVSHGKHSSWFPSSEIHKLKESSGMSARKFASLKGISRSAFKKSKKFVLHNTGLSCGIPESDVRFYKIKSITEVPDQVFYGMSVADHHNLVANGIVAKNCYQEQIMQAFMALADLTASDGYLFMKGCAKKKRSLIDKYKDPFFKGCGKRNISQNVVEKIWSDMEKFGGYAFNKTLHFSECIITSKGEYTIQELFQMDSNKLPQVYSPDGNLIDIVDVYDHGIVPMYEVTFSDGSVHRCTGHHKFASNLGVLPLYEIIKNNYHIVVNKYVSEKNMAIMPDRNVHEGTMESQTRMSADSNFIRCLGEEKIQIHRDEHSTRFDNQQRHQALQDSHRTYVSVISAEYIGFCQGYDLEVDSADHLYCLSSGIVNSNSHATSYAYESYKTAYLKAHYPEEFISARLSVEASRRNFDDAVTKYEIDAEKNYGIKILPTDINRSKLTYRIVGNKQLLRPLIIKGIGDKAAEEIIKHQPYKGKDLLFAFATKVGHAVNHKVMEALYDEGLFGKEKSKKQFLADFDVIRNDKKRNKGRPGGDYPFD